MRPTESTAPACASTRVAGAKPPLPVASTQGSTPARAFSAIALLSSDPYNVELRKRLSECTMSSDEVEASTLSEIDRPRRS